MALSRLIFHDPNNPKMAVAADVDAMFAKCLMNQGAWSGATTYAANDVVTHSGARYIALAASTNVEPGTDSSKWELF